MAKFTTTVAFLLTSCGATASSSSGGNNSNNILSGSASSSSTSTYTEEEAERRRLHGNFSGSVSVGGSVQGSISLGGTHTTQTQHSHQAAASAGAHLGVQAHHTQHHGGQHISAGAHHTQHAQAAHGHAHVNLGASHHGQVHGQVHHGGQVHQVHHSQGGHHGHHGGHQAAAHVGASGSGGHAYYSTGSNGNSGGAGGSYYHSSSTVGKGDATTNSFSYGHGGSHASMSMTHANHKQPELQYGFKPMVGGGSSHGSGSYSNFWTASSGWKGKCQLPSMDKMNTLLKKDLENKIRLKNLPIATGGAQVVRDGCKSNLTTDIVKVRCDVQGKYELKWYCGGVWGKVASSSWSSSSSGSGGLGASSSSSWSSSSSVSGGVKVQASAHAQLDRFGGNCRAFFYIDGHKKRETKCVKDKNSGRYWCPVKTDEPSGNYRNADANHTFKWCAGAVAGAAGVGLNANLNTNLNANLNADLNAQVNASGASNHVDFFGLAAEAAGALHGKIDVSGGLKGVHNLVGQIPKVPKEMGPAILVGGAVAGTGLIAAAAFNHIFKSSGCLIKDKDYPHHDLPGNPLQATPEKCQEKCQDTPACHFFQWLPNNQCWLKNEKAKKMWPADLWENPLPILKFGAIFGPKDCVFEHKKTPSSTSSSSANSSHSSSSSSTSSSSTHSSSHSISSSSTPSSILSSVNIQHTNEDISKPEETNINGSTLTNITNNITNVINYVIETDRDLDSCTEGLELSEAECEASTQDKSKFNSIDKKDKPKGCFIKQDGKVRYNRSTVGTAVGQAKTNENGIVGLVCHTQGSTLTSITNNISNVVNYVIEEELTSSCQQGTELTYEQCKAYADANRKGAFKSLNKVPHFNRINSEKQPKGCFLKKKDNTVRYNDHAEGKANPNKSVICLAGDANVATPRPPIAFSPSTHGGLTYVVPTDIPTIPRPINQKRPKKPWCKLHKVLHAVNAAKHFMSGIQRRKPELLL